MGKYTRKTKRTLFFTEDNLNEIRTRIANGESKRQVAKSLGILESTLRNRLKKGNVPTSLGRYKNVFTEEMEEELANLCKDLDMRFYGLTRKRIMQISYQFAELNGLRDRFNSEKKLAGKDWVKGFLKRHKLSTRKPRDCSLGRAIGFNKTQVTRFFQNLKAVHEEKKFPPHRIFNCDESGLSTVPNKTPKVISPVGKKEVSKVTSGERGQNVTVVACFSATGIYVPPAMIFPRKRMKPELYVEAPVGTLPLISDSGYMNSNIFIDWLKHFARHTKPTEDDPVLLLLDNHSTHISLEGVNFCRDNFITMLSLPPHASHKIQPLDKSFFGPLKTAYSVEVEKWMVSNPGQCVTAYQISGLLREAYNRVSTIEKAVKGFRATGIYPYNPDVFSDEDFLPSSVTDRPQPEIDHQEVLEEVENEEGCDESVNETTVENYISQPGPSSTLTSIEASIEMKMKHNELNVTSNERQVTKASSNIVSVTELTENSDDKTIIGQQLLKIHPLPKCKVVKRQVQAQKSEIISGSPFKKFLEEKKGKKEQEFREKEERRRIKEEKKLKGKGVKRNLDLDEEPKTAKTKKTEGNREMVNGKEEETFCAGCGESFEDCWVQCGQCEQWWHEACSDYVGSGPYICDHC